MEYRIRVVAHGGSAKNKGLISGRWTTRTEREDLKRGWSTENFTIEAFGDDEALKIITAQFRPNDKRPVAGRSYLRGKGLCVLRRARRLSRRLGAVPEDARVGDQVA